MAPFDIIGFALPLLKGILNFVSGLNPIFMLGIFVVFVFIAIKTFQTFIKAIYIAVAAVAFPFVMNYGFGMSIATDMSNLIFFATTGIGIFLAYHLLRFIYKTVSGLAWVGGRFGGSSKEKAPKPVPAPAKGPNVIETVEEDLEEVD